MYLKKFSFPDEDRCYGYILKPHINCYDGNFFPFDFFRKYDSQDLSFDDITIIYGGNGTGKSTILNIIAEKLNLNRDSIFNKTDFYDDFISMCGYDLNEYEFDSVFQNSRIITSDDVFDYIINLRRINQQIDYDRKQLMEIYEENKGKTFNSLEDYEELKLSNKIKSMTKSSFINEYLNSNVVTRSNGESAFKYFIEKIEKPGLYLLDEPENSLSPKNQLELKKYIEDSARYFNCQFIISTHSPFLLSMAGARIYDIEDGNIEVKKWSELENVRIYYDFFKEMKCDFE